MFADHTATRPVCSMLLAGQLILIWVYFLIALDCNNRWLNSQKFDKILILF